MKKKLNKEIKMTTMMTRSHIPVMVETNPKSISFRNSWEASSWQLELLGALHTKM
jgi:hypothetical protein